MDTENHPNKNTNSTMYSLFSTTDRQLSGSIVPPYFKNVAARMKEDVRKVIDYHHNGTFFTGTDHVLLRLIQSVGVPMSYDIDRYYEVASARTLAACNATGLTTTISAGKWHQGVFHHNQLELIIGYNGNDIPSLAMRDWKNLESVKLLATPVSNTGYLIPDGKANNLESGISVVAVDVPRLMIQYRGFLADQKRRRLNGEDVNLGIQHLLGKYVIPNMLKSQTDLVLFNRLYNLVYGAPHGAALRKQPFHISDYSEQLDRGLYEVLKRITNTKLRYRDILYQIPSLYSQYPQLNPDLAETKQVYWALFLSKLKVIGFLFDVFGQEGRHYNQSLINELKIDLRNFKQNNIFSSVLPNSMKDDVVYEIDRIWKGVS